MGDDGLGQIEEGGNADVGLVAAEVGGLAGVAVDQGGAHPDLAGADDVGAGLIADVEGCAGRDRDGGVVEGGVVGAGVGFFPADDGRGDDGVHGVVEGEVGDELGDVGVGVGDDRPLDSRLLQELGGGEDIVENAVGVPAGGGLHLGPVDAADFGDLDVIEGDPSGCAPAAVVFQAEGLLLLAGAVADGDAAVLLGVVILGGDVG